MLCVSLFITTDLNDFVEQKKESIAHFIIPFKMKKAKAEHNRTIQSAQFWYSRILQIVSMDAENRQITCFGWFIQFS